MAKTTNDINIAKELFFSFYVSRLSLLFQVGTGKG